LPSALALVLGKELIKKIKKFAECPGSGTWQRIYYKNKISLPSTRVRTLGKEFIEKKIKNFFAECSRSGAKNLLKKIKKKLSSAKQWTLDKGRQPSPTTIFAECRALPIVQHLVQRTLPSVVQSAKHPLLPSAQHLPLSKAFDTRQRASF